jgi:SAM-dependent methyltransferase
VDHHEFSQGYTHADHVVRDGDRYALAKYKITERWLRPHVRPGQTLLNVGCGSGVFNPIARKMGLQVIGFDPDPAAVALASSKADAQTKLHTITAQEAALRGFRGDYLVCQDVLEHIGDAPGAVAALRRLINPGGRAFISVPAMQWLYGNHDRALGHYRRYDRKSLMEVLEPEFEIVRMRYFGALSIPIVVAFSKIFRHRYPVVAQTDNLLARAYGALCDLETIVTFPIGTSLLAELIPRATAGVPASATAVSGAGSGVRT